MPLRRVGRPAGRLFDRSGSTQRTVGSASTSTARTNSVIGRASNAPSGPSTNVQKTSDRKVTLTPRLSASAWNLGWITDWMTKLIAQ